jgi:hypothetical protein
MEVMANLSALSNSDLKALQAGNMSGISNAGLKALSGSYQSSANNGSSNIKGNLKEAVLGAPANILDGIANSTRNVLNLGADALHLPEIPKGESVRNMAGLPKANIGDKVAEGITEFMPFNAAGDAAVSADVIKSPFVRNLVSQSIAGGLYGASTNPDNAASGALTGAALGAGAGALSKVGESGVKSAATALKQSALRPALQSVKSSFDSSLLPGMSDIASSLKKRYLQLKDNSSALFPMVKEAAKILDAPAKAVDEKKYIFRGFAPVNDNATNFDNSDYVNALKAKLGSIKSEVGNNNNLKSQASESIKQLNGLIKNAPTSFGDAIRERKGINAIPANYFKENKTSDKMLNSVADYARKKLVNQVNKNIESNPEAQEFGDLWDKANKNYSEQSAFTSLPTTSNNLKNSNAMQEAMYGKGSPDGSILNKFVPKSDEGMYKIVHLSKLLGNPDDARNAIRSTILSKAAKENNNPLEILKSYKALSEPQRQFLFSPDERRLLDVAKSSKATSAVKSRLMNHFTRLALGAAGGGIYAEHEGKSALPYMAIGAAGSEYLGHELGKAAMTEGGQKLIKMMQEFKPKGTATNIALQNTINK